MILNLSGTHTSTFKFLWAGSLGSLFGFLKGAGHFGFLKGAASIKVGLGH